MSFIDTANDLYDIDQEKAIDMIYDVVDDLMRQDKFVVLDKCLELACSMRIMHIDILLAILTATLAGKTHLPSRTKLFRMAQELMMERAFPQILIHGLE